MEALPWLAGQEIEGYFCDQSLGLDMLSSIVCASFRTLLLTSVQNLGSRDPFLMKLALDQVWHTSKKMHASKMIFFSRFD